MLTLAILIWLAISHSIVAPWWIWTIWAVSFIIGMIYETIKLIDKYSN